MGYADPLPIEPHYARNPNILRWWTNQHDQLIRETIEQNQWIWHWAITDKICEITPKATIENWRTDDPLCQQYAWYNVLMYFAAARAKQLGYERDIRKPRLQICAVCKESFREDSIPPSIVRHLRLDQIDVCLGCINTYFGSSSESERLGKKKIVPWIKALCEDLRIIPPQSILDSLSSLTYLSTEERSRFLRLAKGKPSTCRVKRLFGSWLNALVEAGVLENGVRETGRGTHCVARDGHVCFSYGEKTIDDYLSSRQVSHGKEPRYPQTNYRADFHVGSYYVEYLGLAGDNEYDRRTSEKERIARENNIPLLVLYPEDLLSEKRLNEKLAPVFESLGPRAPGKSDPTAGN